MEQNNMTAVEWLIEQLVELDKLLDGRRKSDDSTVMKLNPTKIFEQAKQMEKDQSIDLIKQTAMFMGASNFDKEISSMTFEDVYNSYHNK